MNSDTDSNDAETTDEGYTLEFIAAHAGVDPVAILRYQEKGFIRAVERGGGEQERSRLTAIFALNQYARKSAGI